MGKVNEQNLWAVIEQQSDLELIYIMKLISEILARRFEQVEMKDKPPGCL